MLISIPHTNTHHHHHHDWLSKSGEQSAKHTTRHILTQKRLRAYTTNHKTLNGADANVSSSMYNINMLVAHTHTTRVPYMWNGRQNILLPSDFNHAPFYSCVYVCVC